MRDSAPASFSTRDGAWNVAQRHSSSARMHLRQPLAARNHRKHILRLVGDEVEEDQPFLLRERLLERALDVARLLDLEADVAVGFGELHEVRQRVHVRLGVAVAVEELLPLPHHAHVAVVEVHDLDRQVVLLAGRQLLDAHLDRRLAGHAGDRRVGIDHLHAHRRRQAEAHRPEAAGIDPAARLVELVVLRGPHLVLADVGRDECVALGQFVELLDHELRLDQLARAVVLEAILALPLLDLRPPRLQRRGVRPLRRRLQDLQHLLQHVADVADDRHVDLHALADRRRVDVDVDDLAVGAEEVLRVADHAVVEARAHGDQHVAFLHRHVGLVRAVHARHAR